MAPSHRLCALALLCCSLLEVSATPDLQAYLPPVQETPCYAQTRTSIVNNVQTRVVPQPITVAQTQTQFAQAVATASYAITTTMQRVRQSQVVIPVLSTVQQTRFVTSTRVQNVPFQPPPVTRFATSTALQVVTRTNTRFVTQTQTSVRQVFITRTVANTRVQTQFNTQTRFENRQFRQPDVTRFVTQTQFVTRTQQVPALPVTRTIQTQIVQTSQVLQFETPRPFTRTQTVQREVLRTQLQAVQNTQVVTRTIEVTRTQAVPAFTTLVQTSVSVVRRNQNVVRTVFVDRIFTSTQVVPQFITSTRVVVRVNNRVVTQTRQVQGPQVVQTVQGQNDIQQRVVTSFVNQVSTVFRNVVGQQQTILQTVTRPCQQQPQTGYQYRTPRIPFSG